MTAIPKIGDRIIFELGMDVIIQLPLKFHPDGPPLSTKKSTMFITIGERLKKEVKQSLFSSIAEEMNKTLSALAGHEFEMITTEDVVNFFKKNNVSFPNETLDTSTYAGEYEVTKIDGLEIICQKLDDPEKTLSFRFTPDERPLLCIFYSFYDPETRRISRNT